MRVVFAAAAVQLMLATAGQAADVTVEAGDGAAERLMEALILAEPGDTLRIGAGRFELTDGLSLDVDDVVVRGTGADTTVLSFKGQTGAGEGLLVTSDRVVLEEFAVEDTKGDGSSPRAPIRSPSATCAWNGPTGRTRTTAPTAFIRCRRKTC